MKNIIHSLLGRFILVLIAILPVVALVRAADPAPSDKPPAAEKIQPASPLEPLAFLVDGEWEAKLPAQSNAPQVSILAHFTWANNHRAIRISNVYSANGKTMPYIDGLYAWHPQKRVIVFTYVDSQGNFYEGTVKPDSGALLHEFQVVNPKGEATQYSARQIRDGAIAWVNEISSIKDGKLELEIKVRYEKVK